MSIHVSENGRPTVLVVDDTPANLDLLSSLLNARGYRVRPVPRGRLALTAARRDPPDLVLLDICMPEMDGYEVCAALKAEEALRDTPVIFVSALDDTVDKLRAFGAGGVDFVTKPFDIEEVDARLRTHLELQRQKRELKRSFQRLAQMEADREKLLHLIVHDMRSPLLAMAASLEVVRQLDADRLTSAGRRSLHNAEASGRTVVELVDSMLDIYRLESGAMPVHRQPTDVDQLVRRVAESMRELQGSREVTTSVAPMPPQWLDGDLMRRVLQNLISNALQATGERGVVEIAADLVEPRRLRLQVEDNGSGIAAEWHERIFERFAQAHPNKAGSGLGLLFCKLATEAHGGQIGVDSDGRSGSRIWVTVPVGEGEEP